MYSSREGFSCSFRPLRTRYTDVDIPAIAQWSQTLLLVVLRLTPPLAFAPPFTMIKVPSQVRVCLILSLSFALSSGLPLEAQKFHGELYSAATGELALGISMALALQLTFAMIGVAGRMLDIQAGFGLAFLIDPSTKAQTPLFAAVFGYAAGIIFMWTGGLADLLGVLEASFRLIPPGHASGPTDIAPLLRFMAAVTSLSFGVVALATIVLFLIDVSIALLSRTLPQMNVLVLGFQVKSLATLLLLPITLGVGGAAIARMLRLATDSMLAIG